jgi:hypothetical protein
MLWSRPKGSSERWGVVRPNFLAFASAAAGEDVADRYRALYPKEEFAVSETNPSLEQQK